MRRILALQLIACLAIWSANANTIIQTLPFAGDRGSFSDPLSFTQFNTSLGTLTGITISMTTLGYGILTVENTDTSSHGFWDASAKVPVKVVGPDYSFNNSLYVRTYLQTPTYGSEEAPEAAPPSATTEYHGTDVSGSASRSVSSGYWYLYSGGASFAVTAFPGAATIAGAIDPDGQQYLSIGATEYVHGSVTVTFTYDASVPDGGLTAMLLGMGILGLGFVRRTVK